MGRRGGVKGRDRPVHAPGSEFAGDVQGGRGGRRAVRRFVEDRAVEPDDVFHVVLDFRDVVVGDVDLVRPEVAVGDRVVVIVPGARLVHVLRRQGRREGHKRRDEQQGGGPGR
jgi:hypothetical protein